MLKLIEKKGSMVSIKRCPLTAGQRVSRRYRRAQIRRAEYKKLKAIVPSISSKQKVSKVTVIEEAIKYIDELHKALYTRVPALSGRNALPPFLHLSPQSVVAHMLRVTPSLTTPDTASCPLQPPSRLSGPRSTSSSSNAVEPKLHRPVKTSTVSDTKFNTAGARSSLKCITSKQLPSGGVQVSSYLESQDVLLTDSNRRPGLISQGSNPSSVQLTQHRLTSNIAAFPHPTQFYSSCVPHIVSEKSLDRVS